MQGINKPLKWYTDVPLQTGKSQGSDALYWQCHMNLTYTKVKAFQPRSSNVFAHHFVASARVQ